MKIEKIATPGAGTWSRDCELLCLIDYKHFKIIYHRDEDDTYWSLIAEGIIAYKVTTEELSTTGYLINTPTDGAFFEVIDSPWIQELGSSEERILKNTKHYILEFYDETIEIIAQDYIFEQLQEKPIIHI